MFRECLVNDLIPFIIRDENKAYYVHALGTQSVEELVEYFKTEQEWYYNKVRDALVHGH